MNSAQIHHILKTAMADGEAFFLRVRLIDGTELGERALVEHRAALDLLLLEVDPEVPGYRVFVDTRAIASIEVA